MPVTVLAPSERSHEERDQRHRTIPDWARQMITQLRHRVPQCTLVIVADETSAVLAFLAQAKRLPEVIVITRVRLDACVDDPAPKRDARKVGRPPSVQRHTSAETRRASA